MPVNYCDNCHEPPGCCLCYEEEPVRPDLEHLEEWADDKPDCLNCGMCESCIERSIATAEEMEHAAAIERAKDAAFAPSWDGDYEE